MTTQAAIDGAFSSVLTCLQRSAELRALRRSHYWGVGMHSSELFWREDLGIWFTYGTSPTAHWIGLGDALILEASVPLAGLVLGVPRDGINRRLGGLYATDGNGSEYLLHSGKIGGKRRGIGKTEFVRSNQDCETASVIWPDDNKTQYFVLGSLSEAGLSAGIARYVRSVMAFKRDVQRAMGSELAIANDNRVSAYAIVSDGA